MELLSHYIEQQNGRYPEIKNWLNYLVGNQLYYSYRDTSYNIGTYPSELHYHDYYELVIFEEGDIRYICEGSIFYPKYGDIILIPPGKFHMSAINCKNTCYKRHVFYFYPSAFDEIGHGALTSFSQQTKNGELLSFASSENVKELVNLLKHMKEVSESTPSPLEKALGLSYIIQIFYLLNNEKCNSKTDTDFLPENILMLQQYIDSNFAKILSVSQIAEHFFYSREHISRLFRKHFDTTIADYIMKRRIAKSQNLMMQGMSVTDAGYEVGFGSLSTFIRAFRTVTNMTPSEYCKLRKNIAFK